MDYGRYNYGIHGGYFMVYKPLITWGGPSSYSLSTLFLKKKLYSSYKVDKLS